MRECHMQLSGPWPPYHFVHRLTRPGHAQTPAAASTVQPLHAPEATAIALLEPSPAFV
jgi:hypothetical protein